MRQERPSKTPADIEAAEDQIRNQQKVVDYTVLEYPIETLVRKYQEGEPEGVNEIFVPEYQRDFVWDDRRQSRFIESVMIGLPIPYLFVADVGNEDPELAGRLEIIDGTQRIRTLARFMGDRLELIELEKLSALNGFVFSDLPPSRQRRFARNTMRVIALTERANEETRRDMFDRINTGPVKLTDMETRRGARPGPFVDLVRNLAVGAEFVRLAPVSKAQLARFEREELVARFFALREGYENFGTPEVGKVVNTFVDEFTKRMNEKMLADATIENDLKAVWHRMLQFVEQHFPAGFAKSPSAQSTPRVRFEAIAVGVSRALADADPPAGAARINEWLDGPEFKKLTTSDAANNRTRVLGRINYVRDQLGQA